MSLGIPTKLLSLSKLAFIPLISPWDLLDNTAKPFIILRSDPSDG